MDLALLFLLTSVGLGALVVAFAMALRQTRARARRAESLVERLLNERPNAVAGRDDRLEAAVESMASEIERLGDAQRFVARVLIDRSKGGEFARRVDQIRAVTPH